MHDMCLQEPLHKPLVHCIREEEGKNDCQADDFNCGGLNLDEAIFIMDMESANHPSATAAASQVPWNNSEEESFLNSSLGWLQDLAGSCPAETPCCIYDGA
jgi:hypothetical protein